MNKQVAQDDIIYFVMTDRFFGSTSVPSKDRTRASTGVRSMGSSRNSTISSNSA
jgi:hypothetical protein